jgi:hypothetical protein
MIFWCFFNIFFLAIKKETKVIQHDKKQAVLFYVKIVQISVKHRSCVKNFKPFSRYLVVSLSSLSSF